MQCQVQINNKLQNGRRFTDSGRAYNDFKIMKELERQLLEVLEFGFLVHMC
jgi:hypothetical protein